MSHWQHESPLKCPQTHTMDWLGGLNWVCPTCHKLYCEMGPLTGEDLAVMRGGLYSTSDTAAEPKL
jgi:hypothetical protein